MTAKEIYAPLQSLDVPSLISVEYPLRVKNTDKAINMVGGKEKLSKCFIEPEMELELRLRPEDPYSHPIFSSGLKSSENILLQFKIPKKILSENGGSIQKSIAFCESNGIKYHVQPTGILRQTYKFRQLADFQMLTKDSPFLQKYDKSIRAGDFKKIKDFADYLKKDSETFQSFENKDLDLPPLPRYSRSNISHNYKFQGNLLLDEHGEWVNKSVKLHTIIVQVGDPIPTEHDPILHQEYDRALKDMEILRQLKVPERIIQDSPSYHLIECINLLKKIFEMKPIWIRRNIYWLLPKQLRSQLRFALPFVSYSCSRGPWRHSFIKLGYDPTKDPKAVKYQIEAFRNSGRQTSDNEIQRTLENGDDVYIIPQTLYPYIDEFSNPESEINKLKIGKIPRQLFFDGENPCNSFAFQLGDIMDDDIKKILQNATLESICHKGSGWLNWITVCKIRAVIKYKLRCIFNGQAINESKVKELMLKSQFTKSSMQGVRSSDEEGDDDSDDDNENEEPENPEDLKADKEEDHLVHDDEMVDKNDIFKRLQLFNPKSANVLEELDGLLKQESLMGQNKSDTNND